MRSPPQKERRAPTIKTIGVVGAFEATPMATTRAVFETNTFGVMAMTQAVLQQLAEVAARVGYQSASAFSTAFTRLTGRSPSAFARSTD